MEVRVAASYDQQLELNSGNQHTNVKCQRMRSWEVFLITVTWIYKDNHEMIDTYEVLTPN